MMWKIYLVQIKNGNTYHKYRWMYLYFFIEVNFIVLLLAATSIEGGDEEKFFTYINWSKHSRELNFFVQARKAARVFKAHFCVVRIVFKTIFCMKTRTVYQWSVTNDGRHGVGRSWYQVYFTRIRHINFNTTKMYSYNQKLHIFHNSC